MYLDETIAAISTPIGEGGIGIVRLSGKDAIRIVADIFKPYRGRKPDVLPTHTINYGHIIDPESGAVIDEVLLTIMKAPYTYTREDIVEINCHGGIIPLRRVLELILKHGARLAEPGEFTKRAFLNGRIDLTQAEAVIDLINAKTERALRVAMEQLQGGLSRRIESLRDRLIDLIAHIEAYIDFPDDEIEELSIKRMSSEASEILKEIERLINSADEGKILREGVSTAIVGRPNVGKSSLLNALLSEERVIVTEVPGTTRDTIEEFINVKGIPLRIIDTAGIRETDDLIEKEGVKRSLSAAEKADIILLILDAGEPLKTEDELLLTRLKDREPILVLNKSDLPERIDKGMLPPGLSSVSISAKTGAGIERLKEVIIDTVYRGKVDTGEGNITVNLRHKNSLIMTEEALKNFIKGLYSSVPPEILAYHLREALDSLREIVGATTTEDILDRIFQQFCIGK